MRIADIYQARLNKYGNQFSGVMLLVLFLFLLQACGGDSSSDSTQEASSTAINSGTSNSGNQNTNPATPVTTATIFFEDITTLAGLAVYTHGLKNYPRESDIMAIGLAVEDIDNDGDEDIFLSRGTDGYNVLLKNSAAERIALGQPASETDFTDITESYGLKTLAYGGETVTPFFLDIDGDLDMDLLLGGISSVLSNNIMVYKQNNSQQFFLDESTGLNTPLHTYSFSAGDYDRDNDLDIMMAHWAVFDDNSQILWQQENDAFLDITSSSGLGDAYANLEYFNFSGTLVNGSVQFNFSPNFADMDNDGWLDLLIAGDFGHSKYLLNRENSSDPSLRFFSESSSVLSDENGMGAAVGDYDNDGDLDWFVTSIHDPNNFSEGNWGLSGNRLYQNDGSGNLTDVSVEAGVREGYWGWAACFADFNNNGHLDIFQVNGMGIEGLTGIKFDEFDDDPSRLFMADGTGKFIESSVSLGIDDRGQGRGISCFDYDLDGDLDILIVNSGQPPRLYRNNSTDSTPNNYLSVRLRGDGKNTQAIGARVYLTNPLPAGELPSQQMRELRAGTNYASQDPALAHFGVGQATSVDLRIVWPDGASDTVCNGLATGQRVWIIHPNQSGGSGCP